ncbi:acyltransferase, partial [bacterium]
MLELYAHETFLALNGVIYWGNTGVLLFFLISGFIIPATLEREASSWAFPVNRAFRILPLFYFALAAAVIARTVVPEIQSPELIAHPVRTILLNLTLTHYFANVQGVIVLSWTLCVEAFFYLVAWLLRRAGLLVRTEVLVLAGAGLLALQGTRMVVTDSRVGVYLLGWTLLFLVGTLAYRHATGAIRGRGVGVAIAAALILATLTFWDYGRRSGGRLVDSGATSVIVASAAFGICYALRERAWPTVLT